MVKLPTVVLLMCLLIFVRRRRGDHRGDGRRPDGFDSPLRIPCQNGNIIDGSSLTDADRPLSLASDPHLEDDACCALTTAPAHSRSSLRHTALASFNVAATVLRTPSSVISPCGLRRTLSTIARTSSRFDSSARRMSRQNFRSRAAGAAAVSPRPRPPRVPSPASPPAFPRATVPPSYPASTTRAPPVPSPSSPPSAPPRVPRRARPPRESPPVVAVVVSALGADSTTTTSESELSSRRRGVFPSPFDDADADALAPVRSTTSIALRARARSTHHRARRRNARAYFSTAPRGRRARRAPGVARRRLASNRAPRLVVRALRARASVRGQCRRRDAVDDARAHGNR